jgi:uncharacterized protein (DUF1778 family)
MSETKSERIALRVSESQRDLLYEASRASASTLSDFVLGAATRAAADVLADRTTFVLPPERWNAFMEILDRPARSLPRLAALMAETSMRGPDRGGR